MLSLVFVLVLAVVFSFSHGLGHLSSAPEAEGGSGLGLWEGSSTELGRYAIALYSGLWAFDGWDQSNVRRRSPALRFSCSSPLPD